MDWIWYIGGAWGNYGLIKFRTKTLLKVTVEMYRHFTEMGLEANDLADSSMHIKKRFWTARV